ncbi:MAG: type II secretion system F family protein [Eggerthellaceae bacterium]|jgi:tight adherence protein C
MNGQMALLGIGMASAAVCGCFLIIALVEHRLGWKRLQAARVLAADSEESALFVQPEVTGLASRILIMLQHRSRIGSGRTAEHPNNEKHVVLGVEDIERTGMAEVITFEGIRQGRWRCATIGGAVCGLSGLLFSEQLGLIGLFLGICVGHGLPIWALRQEAKTRSEDAERHLSEMLEVVMLGLRSGLPFERAFSLYPQYFDGALASSAEKAVQEWQTGLVRREDALRDLAGQYDSVLLRRVMEDAIRSLRFGNPLADILSSSAVEARALHKARVEERIAKAPVKMMLPVGTLILPAMLLLVMGPVILELISEF